MSYRFNICLLLRPDVTVEYWRYGALGQHCAFTPTCGAPMAR